MYNYGDVMSYMTSSIPEYVFLISPVMLGGETDSHTQLSDTALSLFMFIFRKRYMRHRFFFFFLLPNQTTA